MLALKRYAMNDVFPVRNLRPFWYQFVNMLFNAVKIDVLTRDSMGKDAAWILLILRNTHNILSSRTFNEII